MNKQNITLKHNQILTNYINILSIISYITLIGERKNIFNMNRTINELFKYQQKEFLTQADNEEINKLIKSINLTLIFENVLTQFEKEYCENEFAKFLSNPLEYRIPNLEIIIDNGEILKYYIQYKIEKYEQETIEKNSFNDYKLSKVL